MTFGSVKIIFILFFVNFCTNYFGIEAIWLCRYCQREFPDYAQADYEFHMEWHELLRRHGQPFNSFMPPFAAPNNHRIQTISSERSNNAFYYYFNPPTNKFQQMERKKLSHHGCYYYRTYYCLHPFYHNKFVSKLWQNKFRPRIHQFEDKKYRPKAIRQIKGDGHCLFRSISYALTGTEQYFMLIRAIIADYMYEHANEQWVTENVNVTTDMLTKLHNLCCTNTFGEVEDLIGAAKAFNVNILLYKEDSIVNSRGQPRIMHQWLAYSPHIKSSMDATSQDRRLPSIPIFLSQMHYQVILAIWKKY